MSGRIEHIELKNFGPFATQDIKFERRNESDLSIIIGDNSFGKSSLLKSFKWTLYGDIEGEGSTIKHEGAISEETKVKFSIAKDDHLISISRSDKHGPSCIKLDRDNRSLPTDFDQEIHNLLPKVVKDFFLFRGEFLSNLFEQYNAEELKKAILKLSKIDRFSMIKEAIEKNEEIYREEMIKVEKSNDQLKKQDERIKKYQESIRATNEEMDRMSDRVKALSQHKADANEQLMEITRNQGQLNEKIRLKGKLENDKEQLVKLIREKEPEIKSLFTGQLSDGFVAKQIDLYIKKVKSMEKEGKFPPRVDPPLLQDSLDDHKCALCLGDLDESTEDRLKSILSEVKRAKRNMPLYNLAERCSTSIESLKGIVERFEYRIKEYIDTIEKKDKLSDEIKKLQDDIGVDAEGQTEIQRLTAKISSLDRELHQLSAEREQFKGRIDDFEFGLADAQGKFNRAKSKGSADSEIEFKADLANKFKKKLDDVYDRLKRNLAKNLQEETKNFYDQIFSRIYEYSGYEIVVDEEFTIKVLSKQKFDRLAEGKLSTGEYKVLSLSFLLALSKYYDFEFPIVIDAPFSDLGTKLRKELVQALVNLSKKKQVIIFTLPNIEKEILSQLEENANITYRFVGPGELEVVL